MSCCVHVIRYTTLGRVAVSEADIKYASSLRRMVAYGGRNIKNATEYRLLNVQLRDYCAEVQVPHPVPLFRV